jgi:hypothetical protein
MKFAFKYDIGARVQHTNTGIIGTVVDLTISRHRTIWVNIEYVDNTGKLNSTYISEEELEYAP